MEKEYPARIISLIDRLKGTGPHAHVAVAFLRNLYDFVVETSDVCGDIVDLGCGPGNVTAFLKAAVDHLHLDKEVHAYDAFPVQVLGDGPCHPSGIGIAPCDAEIGVEIVLRTCDTLGVNAPFVHPGWFADTLPTELPNQVCLAVFSGAFHRSVTESLLHCYPRMPVGAIGVLDGYGLGFTPCVQKAADAFLEGKPEWAEIIIAASQAIFRRRRDSVRVMNERLA